MSQAQQYLQTAAEKGKVRPLAALYILERMFHVMTEASLLNPLLAALLGGGASDGGPSLSEFRFDSLEVGFLMSFPVGSVWGCLP